MADNLRSLFNEYLEKHRTMSLATTDSQGNAACAIMCYGVDETGQLIFGADSNTHKVKNIRQNANVAVTISDGNSMSGAMIRGQAQPISDARAMEKARALLKSRHPAVASFLEEPHVAFFRIVASERLMINFSWGVNWRQSVPQ